MYILKGIGAAPGIAIGRIHVIHKTRSYAEFGGSVEPNVEWHRFLTAQQKSIENMSQFQQHALQQYTDDMAKVYKAYLLMLKDEEYIENIRSHIFSLQCAEHAVMNETERLVSCLLKAKSVYLNQRAEDVRAVEKMLLDCLANKPLVDPDACHNAMIIIADELTPADTIVYDPAQLQGFVTCNGGVTSHSVILAKELGIPAIVGVEMDITCLSEDQCIIVDGDQGCVYVEPDEPLIAQYQQQIALILRQKEAMKRSVMDAAHKPSAVSVCANVTSVSEAQKALEHCPDGIGLVRSEFLYMNRNHFPDEKEQLAFYQGLATLMPDKEIVIRTLDIGGDKQAEYIGIPPEENPFLGYRAIRYCLDNPAVFTCQLRAILRASAWGKLKILIPMVTTLEELLETQARVERIKQSLREEGVTFDETIALGIMIETPAAALLADVFARHCDFFSIGSNDLTQYITASDRNNCKVQHLYRAYHPAVLRAIRQVIAAAKQHHIPVHVCGEIASDDKMLPFLVASGVDELSVTPLSILKVKYQVAKMEGMQTQSWVERVMSEYEMDKVEILLTEMAEKIKYL